MTSNVPSTKPISSEVLTPIEDLCQPQHAADGYSEGYESGDNDFEFQVEDDNFGDLDDSNDSEEEPEFSCLPRGKQKLGASGAGAKKGEIRPDEKKAAEERRKAEEKKKNGKK